MAGSGDHIKALVRSHASGDDDAFYAVALQVAAAEARRGHNRLAQELKETIDAVRREPAVRDVGGVTPIARPRGDLADLVSASFPNVGLRDLVLRPELAGQVGRVLHEQRQRQALLRRGYVPVHRLLLEGPPGTGKTLTASVLAHELALPVLTVRLDSLLSKFMGETSSKLRVLFDAISEQRGLYLFDEFDALGGDRAGNDVGEARRILNSFLVFLENASPESMVVAATNHRAILDRALFRRFDLVMVYDLPDAEQAVAVLRGRLGSMSRGIRWSRVARSADGLSHADLVRAAEDAAKAAILENRARVDVAGLNAALDARRAASIG